MGDTAEDQEEGAGAVVGALQDRAGEDVENPAAVVADNGLAVAAMGQQLIRLVAVGASQPLRMKPGDQLIVAGVFIPQIGDGEIHGAVSLVVS